MLETICQDWPTECWQDLHVAVALSGGCDSTALLRALHEIKAECGGTGNIFALHVNHQLRGNESQQDAQWCQQLCAKLGIPLSVLIGIAGTRAEIDGDGLEAAARAERYELLTTAAEELGCRYLVLAHTQNDQVETVLFRLLRGSGFRGLAGIPQTRQLTSSLTLVRPLLTYQREQLVEYLASLGQSYREDSSNCEQRFSRNRLRHNLLPELRENFNQDVDGALIRLASQAENVQKFLVEQARELLSNCSVSLCNSAESNEEVSLAIAPLTANPEVLVCEALRELWRMAKFPEQAMTHGKWLQLAQLSQTTSRCTSLNLPGGVLASVVRGRLILRREAK